MNALIMMLFNTSLNTYHPIMYWEKLFPGGYDAEINNTVIRYQSKGHHTNGFKDRSDAVALIETELVGKLQGMGYVVNKELEGDIKWDGQGIPADNQLRAKATL